jgi:hypothetical protein
MRLVTINQLLLVPQELISKNKTPRKHMIRHKVNFKNTQMPEIMLRVS